MISFYINLFILLLAADLLSECRVLVFVLCEIGLWFVWGCACLPVFPYKKRTSELFSATLTPQPENRAETGAQTI